jgi:2-haloacid dehalogenase
MLYTRRAMLQLAAGGVVARPWLSDLAAQAAPQPRFQAIAFDAFPIFDPRPIFALAETLFPGKGTELSTDWRTRQFEYQWLRALAGQYVDFWQATDDALGFAATLLHLDLTPDKRQQLMAAYLRLQAWPEVPQALQALKRAGLRAGVPVQRDATDPPRRHQKRPDGRGL